MQLDEFISTVLSNVVSGIREAQEIEGIGAFIVPSAIGHHDYGKHPRVSGRGDITTTITDFDIAVTVEESESKSKGGGLKVYGVGAEMEGETTSKGTLANRIQFAVPILLPKSKRQWHTELENGS